MRSAAAASVLLILTLACASSGSDAGDPEIQLRQLSNVADAARHITGGISVQYSLSIRNTTPTPLQLKRVDLQSVGMGAYRLEPLSKPFDVALGSGETKTVELWGPAYIDDPTIVGANGPVTIRAVVRFESAKGTFQTIVVQQVHANGSI